MSDEKKLCASDALPLPKPSCGWCRGNPIGQCLICQAKPSSPETYADLPDEATARREPAPATAPSEVTALVLGVWVRYVREDLAKRSTDYDQAIAVVVAFAEESDRKAKLAEHDVEEGDAPTLYAHRFAANMIAERLRTARKNDGSLIRPDYDRRINALSTVLRDFLSRHVLDTVDSARATKALQENANRTDAPRTPNEPSLRYAVRWMRENYPLNRHAREWADALERVFLSGKVGAQ